MYLSGTMRNGCRGVGRGRVGHIQDGIGHMQDHIIQGH